MKIKNTFNWITKDLVSYKKYISKEDIPANLIHLKSTFCMNKKYFLALIAFEKSEGRISCSYTIDNYKKGLELFIDLIDWHNLSYQEKKKVNGTISWLSKIHMKIPETQFNEWNLSFWEIKLFQKSTFWTKKSWLIIPIIIAVLVAIFPPNEIRDRLLKIINPKAVQSSEVDTWVIHNYGDNR